MSDVKVTKFCYGTKTGNASKFIETTVNTYNEAIQRVGKYTTIQIGTSPDNDRLAIIGPYVTSPRSVYFLGLQLDVDTGFILSSSVSGEDGFLLFPLYDYLSEGIKGFNKEIFLANLEYLKMNKVGEKKPGKFTDIITFLLQDTDTNSVVDIEGSICRKTLRKLDTSTKSGNSVNNQKDGVDLTTLSMDLFLQMQMCLDVRDTLNRIIPISTEDTLSLQQEIGQPIWDNKPLMYRDLYILDDEDGIFNSRITRGANMSVNYVDSYFDSDNYDDFYSGNQDAMKDFFELSPGSLEAMQSADWIYDNTYNKIYTKSDDAYKEGKAIKLYSNLSELMEASKGDEDIEMYNLFKEDYDVAKKEIKKTSLKDIVKGSYLTNVLKNVTKIFNKGEFSNTDTIKTRIGNYPKALINQIKANKHLCQIIKKALSLI